MRMSTCLCPRIQAASGLGANLMLTYARNATETLLFGTVIFTFNALNGRMTTLAGKNVFRTYYFLSTFTPHSLIKAVSHVYLMVNYISAPVSDMASKVGLGVPMPLLAPATATWAAPFAAYYLFLQQRIVVKRFGTKTALGDKSGDSESKADPLFVCSRAQANFAENVPLILGVALLAELNGANRSYINYALGALFALRVGHVELGLMIKNGTGIGRPIGFVGTQAVLAGLAGYAAYLIKDYWMIG